MKSNVSYFNLLPLELTAFILACIVVGRITALLVR